MPGGHFSIPVLSNMDMVLAKSDIAIALRYAGLVEDGSLRDRIFPQLHLGFRRGRPRDYGTIHLTINGIAAELRNSG
jgi:phosphoenolpyruvate carboxylase